MLKLPLICLVIVCPCIYKIELLQSQSESRRHFCPGGLVRSKRTDWEDCASGQDTGVSVLAGSFFGPGHFPQKGIPSLPAQAILGVRAVRKGVSPDLQAHFYLTPPFKHGCQLCLVPQDQGLADLITQEGGIVWLCGLASRQQGLIAPNVDPQLILLLPFSTPSMQVCWEPSIFTFGFFMSWLVGTSLLAMSLLC